MGQILTAAQGQNPTRQNSVFGIPVGFGLGRQHAVRLELLRSVALGYRR